MKKRKEDKMVGREEVKRVENNKEERKILQGKYSVFRTICGLTF